LYALNPGSTVRCFAAWSLWFAGRPAEALVRIREAVTLARESSEPHSLAHALSFAAMLHQVRTEPDMARQYAEATMSLSSEDGAGMNQGIRLCARARALTLLRGGISHLPQIREGPSAWESTGARLMGPHCLGLLAVALRSALQREEGLRVLEEALATAEATGE